MSSVFKRLDKPVLGKVQGNVFFITGVKAGWISLQGRDGVEVPPNLLLTFGIQAEVLGLTGLAEFCVWPSGNHTIDWLNDDGTSLVAAR
jgi:hypothetical protein